MIHLQWHKSWDLLRATLNTRTTWGRKQIIEEMDRIERAMVRESEQDFAGSHKKEPYYGEGG